MLKARRLYGEQQDNGIRVKQVSGVRFQVSAAESYSIEIYVTVYPMERQAAVHSD